MLDESIFRVAPNEAVCFPPNIRDWTHSYKLSQFVIFSLDTLMWRASSLSASLQTAASCDLLQLATVDYLLQKRKARGDVL